MGVGWSHCLSTWAASGTRVSLAFGDTSPVFRLGGPPRAMARVWKGCWSSLELSEKSLQLADPAWYASRG